MPDNNEVKLNCRKCKTRLDLSACTPFVQVSCPVCGTVLRVPKRFERYWLEKVCGIGGISKVYRAIDAVSGERFAVKIVKPEAGSPEELSKQFQSELSLVARLVHRAIIPIFRADRFEEQVFLVMRYMPHGSLHQQKQQHPDFVTIGHLCRWFAAVADALRYAQTFRVVHHDIKPGNILLNDSYEAMLGDFDLADIRNPGDPIPVAGNWGSPGYVSPERIYDGCEDSRGDIFSLGVTLYELLGDGTMPFKEGKDAEELLKNRRGCAYAPLGMLNREVPDDLANLVRRMMAFEPEKRPEYPEIIATLKRYADESEIVRE